MNEYITYVIRDFKITFTQSGVNISRIDKEHEGEMMGLSYDSFNQWLHKMWDAEF